MSDMSLDSGTFFNQESGEQSGLAVFKSRLCANKLSVPLQPTTQVAQACNRLELQPSVLPAERWKFRNGILKISVV